jgi:hypothetical protein
MFVSSLSVQQFYPTGLTAENTEKKYAESHRETLVHGLSGSLRLTLANSAVKMYLCNMSN